MKAKKYDWLLKLGYVADDNDCVISYVNVFDSTRTEVARIVDRYRKNYVVVCVYKLHPLL